MPEIKISKIKIHIKNKKFLKLKKHEGTKFVY